MDQLISRETLDMLSFRSTLGQSLKQISLRATPLETILDDIAKYRSSYIDVLVQENLIGSRFRPCLKNGKTPSRCIFFRQDCVDFPCQAPARLRKIALPGIKICPNPAFRHFSNRA